MPVKYIKASMPHIRLASNITLIIGTILVIAFGAFAIRMQQGPMDLDFAKSRIEAALSNVQEGYEVKIGKINLIWPQIIGPLLLDLKDVRIQQGNVTALSVDNVDLGLSGAHLLIGKVLPSRIIIDGPAFHLIQNQDGGIDFFWQKNEEVKETKKEKSKQDRREMRKSARNFFEEITNPDKQDYNVLAALKKLEITRAVITTQSENEDKPRYLALADLSLEKSFVGGLSGNLNIMLPGEQGAKSYLKSDIVYRRNQKDMTFTAEVSDINPARYAYLIPDNNFLNDLDIDFNGAIQAAFDEKFKIQSAMLNLGIPEGKLDLPEHYDAPIPLNDVKLEAYLNRQEKILEIKNLQGTVSDIPMQITARGTIAENQINLPLEARIQEMKVESIRPLVPTWERETPFGEWMMKKLSDGVVKDVVFKSDVTMTRDPETRKRNINAENSTMSFLTEGMTITYSDTLMPVKDANSEGLYENDTLTVKSSYGKIGDITSTDVVLKMTDLSVEGGGFADIKINNAKGPLKTALQYVSDEPINISDKLDFDVNDVKGEVTFSAQMNFPTVKDLPKEEVKVEIDGVVNDILLPKVVQGLSLTGGPYDLGFKDGLISLKGSGQLHQRPITLHWQEYLDGTGKDFESKVVATVQADDGLRNAFGVGLEEYISGSMPVDVTYIDKGVKATLDVKGDVGPSTIHIEPFDYLKNPGVAGNVSFKGILSGNNLEEIDNVKLETKDFNFSNARILFRKLKDGSTDISRGAIPNATIGKTNVNADFEVTPQNTLKIIASGPVVDLAPFLGKKKEKWDKPKDKEDEKPLIVSVTADKVLAVEGEELRDTKIYMEANANGDMTRLEMDSKIGEGSIYLRFKPEEDTGKRTFRMESSDAGYTLKAFGLYGKAKGGKLTIYGQPAEGDNKGNLYGQARIDDFHVKGAPVLAKLIDAMSMKGVQNLLKNDGVAFKRLESDFEWQFHDGGNFLVVRDGRTSGSSLGLTFEGNFDQAKDEVDFSGTIVPISGVNNVVGNIPVIGDILTGGGALIAATYSIKGSARDPKVAVNPLSALAPGFLRKILFEKAPDEAPKR